MEQKTGARAFSGLDPARMPSRIAGAYLLTSVDVARNSSISLRTVSAGIA